MPGGQWPYSEPSRLLEETVRGGEQEVSACSDTWRNSTVQYSTEQYSTVQYRRSAPGQTPAAAAENSFSYFVPV